MQTHSIEIPFGSGCRVLALWCSRHEHRHLHAHSHHCEVLWAAPGAAPCPHLPSLPSPRSALSAAPPLPVSRGGWSSARHRELLPCWLCSAWLGATIGVCSWGRLAASFGRAQKVLLILCLSTGQGQEGCQGIPHRVPLERKELVAPCLLRWSLLQFLLQGSVCSGWYLGSARPPCFVISRVTAHSLLTAREQNPSCCQWPRTDCLSRLAFQMI